MFKLAKRNFLRYPHYSLVAGMFVLTFSLSSFVVYKFVQDYRSGNYSTFTKWESFQDSPQKRTPASNHQISCDQNHVDLNILKAEVAQLESKFQTGSNIQGSLNGLSYSSLSSIGAQMLADHRSLIGNKNKEINFASCDSVPCALNMVYQDDSQLSGYLAYYWYLKTGSMLSMTNYVPGQQSDFAGNYNKQSFAFHEYLFNQEELKNFYFLAKSLPAKLTFTPLLKSIHKVPGIGAIEGQRGNCSTALPSGSILMGQNCYNGNKNRFFISMTKEIAKYVDRHEGLKIASKSLSLNENWLGLSLWVKETYFNPYSKKFNYRWTSELPQNNFVDNKSKHSPEEQISSLIAQYRFSPENFLNKTPVDIAAWVKNHVFDNQSFDPSGLYKQYSQQALNSWSKQEAGIWKSCIQEFVDLDNMDETNRKIASTLDHPLFTCVENKIPAFIEYTKNKIKKDNFEGCHFFSDEQKYGHESKRFHHSISKYLQEKVLQRKIEFKRHGKEVLLGQKLKSEFISEVDPKSLFINCFSQENAKECYEEELESKVSRTVSGAWDLSEYYEKIIKDDILSLFPFQEVKGQTDKTAKMFLAPYTARLSQAANKIWASCKDEGMDLNSTLNLPLNFTGGKHFVNAKLLNCINNKIKSEISELAELKAKQTDRNESIEFVLNDKEQAYAQNFLEGKLKQTLHTILEQEVAIEKSLLVSHFQNVKQKTLKEFQNSSEMTEDIFSIHQVSNTCLEKVTEHYPKNYFYHSKVEMDKKFGRTICSVFIKQPAVRQKLNAQVGKKWEMNKSLTKEFLVESFSDLVEDCDDDYPTKGRSREAMKNKRLRKICIEESYGQAVSEAIEEWRDHDHYEYFSHREQKLVNHLFSVQRNLVNKAIRHEKL